MQLVIVGISIAAGAFCALFCYSACKVSSEASRAEERLGNGAGPRIPDDGHEG